jgi:hypothetical protein
MAQIDADEMALDLEDVRVGELLIAVPALGRARRGGEGLAVVERPTTSA